MATNSKYDEEKKVAVVSSEPLDADVPAYDNASSIDTITALVQEGEKDTTTQYTIKTNCVYRPPA